MSDPTTPPNSPSLLPPVPQTNRRPPLLSAEQEEQLLSRRMEGDYSDHFASDTDTDIRRLGRLALRRDLRTSADAFALGDLCARRSLRDDSLLILYAGKTLIAYRRAGKQAVRQDERDLAAQAVENYIRWVLQIAAALPSPRNIAVALWAAADLAPHEQPAWMRETATKLAERYGSSLPPRPTERETVEVRAVPMNLIGGEVDDAEAIALDDDPEDDWHSLIQPISSDSESDDSLHSEAWAERGELPTDADAAAPALIAAVESQENRKAPVVVVSPSVNAEDGKGDFRAHDWLFDRDPGVQKDRYEVRRLLRGGMGVVYICLDHQTGLPVAIKTFQGKLLNNDRAVARFEQEALMWMRLEKHPNIVQARKIQRFGSDRVAERPHIILEYVPHAEGLSADLKSWIDSGALTVETALRIALDVARGMRVAVERVPGLVHRDLKPGNILITHEGIAKVTDFGLARIMDQEQAEGDGQANHAPVTPTPLNLTRAGAIVGTAAYLSPEQCNAQPTDARSDIYAFGAILFEMLTRRQLFPQARTFDEWVLAHRFEVPRFPDTLLSGTPLTLRRLIMDCVDKEPSSRPQSWADLYNELGSIYEFEQDAPAPDMENSQMELAELMDKAYGLSEIGYHADAVATYDRALEIAPPARQSWVLGRRANALRFNNALPDALATYDRALGLDQSAAWLWHGRGQALERMGRYAEALESYRQAVQLAQNSRRGQEPRYLFALGQMALRLNDIQTARASFSELLAVDPHNARARSGLASALAAQGERLLALDEIDQALALNPADSMAWYRKARLLRQLHRDQEAHTAAVEAIRLQPDNKWAWLLLAEVQLKLRHYDDGVIAAQRVTSLDPGFAEGWAVEGQFYAALKRHREALGAFDRAILLDRGRAWYWYNKALALTGLTREAEALEALDEALTLDDGYAQAWALRGQVLRKLGRFKEALDALDQAVALSPAQAWMWDQRGLTLAQMGRHADSITSYERAVTINKSNVWYYLHQIDPLVALGRRDQALDICDAALQVAPNSTQVLNRKGGLLRQMERHQEALDTYDQLLRLKPDDAGAWYGKGRAHAALNHLPEALESYRQGAQRNPNGAWLWSSYGDLLLVTGQAQAAIAAFNHVLELDPHNRTAQLHRTEARKLLGDGEG
ncbi:MAG: tetratricopeptide repeat protein [Anaerolineae bacterium]